MNDEELIGRLRSAYQEAAAKQVHTPPSLDELESTVRVRSTRQRQPRYGLMATVLAAAAVFMAATVFVGKRTGEPQAAQLDFSSFGHLGLRTIPDGFALVDVVQIRAGGELTIYQRGRQAINLYAIRPGDGVPGPLDGTTTTFVGRGVQISRTVGDDGIDELRWTEHPGLDVVVTHPPGLDVENLVLAVDPFEDEVWVRAIATSGFVSENTSLTLRAIERNGGPATIKMSLTGSLQRGLSWFLDSGSHSIPLVIEEHRLGTQRTAGRAVISVAKIQLLNGDGGFVFTRDRELILEIDGQPVSSTFAHPGYPGVYLVWADKGNFADLKATTEAV